MSSHHLKQCPFCGNTDTSILIHQGDGSAVVCSTAADGCGVQTPWQHDEQQAINNWNARTANDCTVDKVELANGG